MTLKTGSRELKVMPLYLNLLEINLVTALKYQYGFKGAFFLPITPLIASAVGLITPALLLE